MQVLVICGAGYVSGLEVVTLSLIEGLRDRGHEVRCITTTWGDGDFAGRLKDRHIPYVRLPVGFISKTLTWSAIRMTLDQLRRLPQLWFGYYCYVRDFKPDIIIHSNFQHVFLLWLFLGRSRNVFHVHNAFPATKFYRALFGLLALRLERFIGVSKFVAETLAALGIPESKITFVHNGVAVTALHRPEDLSGGNTTSVVESGYAPREVGIGIVGQIGEWKGHDDLFEALCLLKTQNVGFNCKVFGRGDAAYVDSLKEKLAKCGLTEQVHWAGFVNHAEEIFSAIDICVVPSRFHEPFGMVAAEAAYFGIPVVASDRGGLSEVVCDGRSGFLVPAKSPEQIAEKLCLLIRNQTLRRKIGVTAREHFATHFTQAKMAEHMEAILQQN